jgi:YfiH family protein
MKNRSRRSTAITIPRLERIPILRHGFGDRAWQETDFTKRMEEEGFRPLFLKQIHSDIIHFIDDPPRRTLWGDAMITRLPGLLLVIKTADCLPVLLVDAETRVVAAVHGGWKGLSLKVLEKTVEGMRDHYSVDPGSLLVASGPCIGGGCYEVGTDVRDLYEAEGFPASLFSSIPDRPGKSFLDLRAAARLQLLENGVLEGNIFAVDICTHCDPAFPSYRRDKDDCGRMLSFIGITPP